MKKYSIITIICLFNFLTSISQVTCVVDNDSTNRIVICDEVTNFYIPTSTTKELTIKINFHFMLKGDTTLNFREFDDGLGDSTFTALDFSNTIVEIANARLAGGVAPNLPQGNSIPILNKKYRLILTGVFFHTDENNYTYQNANVNQLLTLYGNNVGHEVNIFWVYDNNSSGYAGGGKATMSGNRWLLIKAAWQKYRDYGNAGFWGRFLGIIT